MINRFFAAFTSRATPICDVVSARFGVVGASPRCYAEVMHDGVNPDSRWRMEDDFYRLEVGMNGNDWRYIELTDTTMILAQRTATAFGEGLYLFDGAQMETRSGGLEVKNANSSAYAAVTAFDYFTSSGMQTKKDIAPLRQSALDILRNAPVREWRYVTEGDDAPVHVGFIADDLPDWLRQPPPPEPSDNPLDVGVAEPFASSPRLALGTLIGLLGQALREIDAEMDELRQLRGLTQPTRRKEIE